VTTENALTVITLRVRFCETDLMGIVHHANHLAYFEAGRVEWLRRRGVTYADWARRGMHLPVVETGIRYKAPALFDEVLTLETRLAQLRSHSLRFEYRLLRGETLLAEGFTRLACVDASHALQRIPEAMLDVFSSAERQIGLV
jgi:acyl-CoA thioester hydrolase